MKKIKIAIPILLVILIIFLIIILVQKRKIDSLPKEIDLKTPTELVEIEPNEFNNYEYKKIDEKQKIIYLFSDFKEKELYSVENAYNILNDEYKQKKYGNIDAYKEYINSNIYELKKSYIYAYKIEKYDNYTQYLISDQYDRYYIFNETSPMEYTVILDMYTIELPSFVEEYNSSEEKKKVLLNVQKIIQALNDEDYTYVYNYLDEDFKKGNYATLEDFIEFINKKLYSKMKLQVKDYINEGSTHICNIMITNARNIENPGINMQIIMKLKENRDFVMSFSLQ